MQVWNYIKLHHLLYLNSFRGVINIRRQVEQLLHHFIPKSYFFKAYSFIIFSKRWWDDWFSKLDSSFLPVKVVIWKNVLKIFLRSWFVVCKWLKMWICFCGCVFIYRWDPYVLHKVMVLDEKRIINLWFILSNFVGLNEVTGPTENSWYYLRDIHF